MPHNPLEKRIKVGHNTAIVPGIKYLREVGIEPGDHVSIKVDEENKSIIVKKENTNE